VGVVFYAMLPNFDKAKREAAATGLNAMRAYKNRKGKNAKWLCFAKCKE
jgi:hypothetical protein